MDKRKRNIIIITILILIMIVALIVTIVKMREKVLEEERLSVESEGNPDDEYVHMFDSEIKRVTSRNDFYIVKGIIDRYYLELSELSDPLRNNDIYEVEGEEFDFEKAVEELRRVNKKAIYSFLDEEYISTFKVTENNLLEKLGEYGDISVLTNEMYVSENSTSMATYFVNGRIKDNDTLEISEFTLMVTLDLESRTFNIAPYEYMVEKGYDKFNEGQKLTRSSFSIKEKIYNKYDYKNISDEKVALDYIEVYKTFALYSQEEAYNLLDKQYGEKRFGSLENYKQYIRDNLSEVNNLTIISYLVEGREGERQYICLDQNGKYYIMSETSIMNFSVILDTYTVDLPQFLEKYNSTSTQGRVMMNIQKFVDSINAKDYKYAYEKLADSFKNNYFSTVQSFEGYMTRTLYNSNHIEYIKYSEEAGLSTYTVRFSDAENGTDGDNAFIEKVIIMQLREGTDFALSFNVD